MDSYYGYVSTPAETPSLNENIPIESYLNYTYQRPSNTPRTYSSFHSEYQYPNVHSSQRTARINDGYSNYRGSESTLYEMHGERSHFAHNANVPLVQPGSINRDSSVGNPVAVPAASHSDLNYQNSYLYNVNQISNMPVEVTRAGPAHTLGPSSGLDESYIAITSRPNSAILPHSAYFRETSSYSVPSHSGNISSSYFQKQEYSPRKTAIAGSSRSSATLIKAEEPTTLSAAHMLHERAIQVKPSVNHRFETATAPVPYAVARQDEDAYFAKRMDGSFANIRKVENPYVRQHYSKDKLIAGEVEIQKHKNEIYDSAQFRSTQSHNLYQQNKEIHMRTNTVEKQVTPSFNTHSKEEFVLDLSVKTVRQYADSTAEKELEAMDLRPKSLVNDLRIYSSNSPNSTTRRSSPMQNVSAVPDTENPVLPNISMSSFFPISGNSSNNNLSAGIKRKAEPSDYNFKIAKIDDSLTSSNRSENYLHSSAAALSRNDNSQVKNSEFETSTVNILMNSESCVEKLQLEQSRSTVVSSSNGVGYNLNSDAKNREAYSEPKLNTFSSKDLPPVVRSVNDSYCPPQVKNNNSNHANVLTKNMCKPELQNVLDRDNVKVNDSKLRCDTEKLFSDAKPLKPIAECITDSTKLKSELGITSENNSINNSSDDAFYSKHERESMNHASSFKKDIKCSHSPKISHCNDVLSEINLSNKKNEDDVGNGTTDNLGDEKKNATNNCSVAVPGNFLEADCLNYLTEVGNSAKVIDTSAVNKRVCVDTAGELSNTVSTTKMFAFESVDDSKNESECTNISSNSCNKSSLTKKLSTENLTNSKENTTDGLMVDEIDKHSNKSVTDILHPATSKIRSKERINSSPNFFKDRLLQVVEQQMEEVKCQNECKKQILNDQCVKAERFPQLLHTFKSDGIDVKQKSSDPILPLKKQKDALNALQSEFQNVSKSFSSNNSSSTSPSSTYYHTLLPSNECRMAGAPTCVASIYSSSSKGITCNTTSNYSRPSSQVDLCSEPLQFDSGEEISIVQTLNPNYVSSSSFQLNPNDKKHFSHDSAKFHSNRQSSCSSNYEGQLQTLHTVTQNRLISPNANTPSNLSKNDFATSSYSSAICPPPPLWQINFNKNKSYSPVKQASYPSTKLLSNAQSSEQAASSIRPFESHCFNYNLMQETSPQKANTSDIYSTYNQNYLKNSQRTFPYDMQYSSYANYPYDSSYSTKAGMITSSNYNKTPFSAYSYDPSHFSVTNTTHATSRKLEIGTNTNRNLQTTSHPSFRQNAQISNNSTGMENRSTQQTSALKLPSDTGLPQYKCAVSVSASSSLSGASVEGLSYGNKNYSQFKGISMTSLNQNSPVNLTLQSVKDPNQHVAKHPATSFPSHPINLKREPHGLNQFYGSNKQSNCNFSVVQDIKPPLSSTCAFSYPSYGKNKPSTSIPYNLKQTGKLERSICHYSPSTCSEYQNYGASRQNIDDKTQLRVYDRKYQGDIANLLENKQEKPQTNRGMIQYFEPSHSDKFANQHYRYSHNYADLDRNKLMDAHEKNNLSSNCTDFKFQTQQTCAENKMHLITTQNQYRSYNALDSYCTITSPTCQSSSKTITSIPTTHLSHSKAVAPSPATYSQHPTAHYSYPQRLEHKRTLYSHKYTQNVPVNHAHASAMPNLTPKANLEAKKPISDYHPQTPPYSFPRVPHDSQTISKRTFNSSAAANIDTVTSSSQLASMPRTSLIPRVPQVSRFGRPPLHSSHGIRQPYAYYRHLRVPDSSKSSATNNSLTKSTANISSAYHFHGPSQRNQVQSASVKTENASLHNNKYSQFGKLQTLNVSDNEKILHSRDKRVPGTSDDKSVTNSSTNSQISIHVKNESSVEKLGEKDSNKSKEMSFEDDELNMNFDKLLSELAANKNSIVSKKSRNLERRYNQKIDLQRAAENNEVVEQPAMLIEDEDSESDHKAPVKFRGKFKSIKDKAVERLILTYASHSDESATEMIPDDDQSDFEQELIKEIEAKSRKGKKPNPVTNKNYMVDALKVSPHSKSKFKSKFEVASKTNSFDQHKAEPLKKVHDLDFLVSSVSPSTSESDSSDAETSASFGFSPQLSHKKRIKRRADSGLNTSEDDDTMKRKLSSSDEFDPSLKYENMQRKGSVVRDKSKKKRLKRRENKDKNKSNLFSDTDEDAYKRLSTGKRKVLSDLENKVFSTKKKIAVGRSFIRENKHLIDKMQAEEILRIIKDSKQIDKLSDPVLIKVNKLRTKERSREDVLEAETWIKTVETEIQELLGNLADTKWKYSYKKPNFRINNDFEKGWQSSVKKFKFDIARVPESLIFIAPSPIKQDDIESSKTFSDSPKNKEKASSKSKFGIVRTSITKNSLNDEFKAPSRPDFSNSMEKFFEKVLVRSNEEQKLQNFANFTPRVRTISPTGLTPTPSLSLIHSDDSDKSPERAASDSVPIRPRRSSIASNLMRKLKQKYKGKKLDAPWLVKARNIIESSNKLELLPTPGISAEENDFSKTEYDSIKLTTFFTKESVNRYREIFDSVAPEVNEFITVIAPSRTRNKSKEILDAATIRAIFGDDPPTASIICEDRLKNDYCELKFKAILSSQSPITSNISRSSSTPIDLLFDDDSEIRSERSLSRLRAYVIKEFDEKRKNKSRKLRKFRSGFDDIRKNKKLRSEEEIVRTSKKKTVARKRVVWPEQTGDIANEIRLWFTNKGLGETVLHKAARLQYHDVVLYCLENLTFNVNVKDNAGYTPLHEACNRGNLDVAQALCAHKAHLNASGFRGSRPLHEATENGHVEVVRLLLSYGGDPSQLTYGGQTCQALAHSGQTAKFMNEYLADLRAKNAPNWNMNGPADFFDSLEDGCKLFNEIPRDAEKAEEISPEKESCKNVENLDESISFYCSDLQLPNLYSVVGHNSQFYVLSEMCAALSLSQTEFIQVAGSVETLTLSQNEVNFKLKSLIVGNKVKRKSRVILVKDSPAVQKLFNVESVLLEDSLFRADVSIKDEANNSKETNLSTIQNEQELVLLKKTFPFCQETK